MSLTKQQRDALPAADFAVPGKRVLPMHDERHVKLAWDMVDRTKDLTEAERKAARSRILEKAKSLGIDTSDWSTIKAMRLDAMSLDMPQTEDHPNKMPFSGILCRIDKPSDAAPEGSGGKRVYLSKAVAEKALSSLLGMAVDYTPKFDGHDPQRKVGLITEATIQGDAVRVEGFIYAADFPDVADDIRANKDLLGFSYEMKRVLVADRAADPLVILDCVFTGAAILDKDKAAYQTTSLAAAKASGAQEDINMDKEELMAALGEVIAPITARLEKIEASQTATTTELKASKELHAKVAPHAEKLRACAAGMAAAGIGMHDTQGHVAVLNRMADRMEAEAMVGKMPHIYRDHDSYNAGADDKATKTVDASAIEEALKPLKDKIAAQETQIADMKAAATKTDTSKQPDRKTIPPAITTLLARADITMPQGEDKLDIGKVDAALGKASLSIGQRIEVKTALRNAGMLA